MRTGQEFQLKNGLHPGKQYEILKHYYDEDTKDDFLGIQSYYEIEDDEGEIIIIRPN